MSCSALAKNTGEYFSVRSADILPIVACQQQVSAGQWQ